MRLKVSTKLAAGFGSLLALMLISAATAYTAMGNMSAQADQTANDAVPALRACDDLLISLNRAAALLRGYLLLPDQPEQERIFAGDLLGSATAVREAMDRVRRYFADSTNPDDQLNFQNIESNLEELLAAHRAVREAVVRQPDAPGTDITAALNLLDERVTPTSRVIQEAAIKLKESAAQRVVDRRNELTAIQAEARTTLFGITAASVVIGTIVSLVLGRQIVQSIHSLLEQVQRVSEGDLTVATVVPRSNDEIADLTRGVNQMVVALREILSNVLITIREASTSSGEISTGAQQQLASLNETAASLNEVSITAEEFKATMQEFADRARAVQEATDETAQRTRHGQELTRESLARVDRVRENALAAGESVLHLSEQMHRIGEITATVNEIAEQTKLLALNASIEAARAGEQGRGFAVVATQVRELANQSKESAARIETLISETQRAMRDVVGRIEEGGRISDDATSLIRQLADSFDEIAQAMEQTRTAMTQINSGARQQEQGITALVASLSEIDGASRQSVVAADQAQKAIAAIDNRLQSLHETASTFRT